MSWRGRIFPNLQQISFYFSPSKTESSGLEAWISKNYKELKQLNPLFPFTVRPYENIESIMTFRYG
jgi:hypothetical protein